MVHIPYVDEYQLIGRLEIKLRRLIDEKLSVVCKDWWAIRVPINVLRQVDKNIHFSSIRRGVDRNNINLSKLHFLGLRGYSDIITSEPNWREVFQEVFSVPKHVLVDHF